MCTALASPAALIGQELRWQADVSGSRISWDSLSALNAPGFNGLLEWRRPATFARLTSGVTGFEDSGWSIQGGAEASHWVSPFGPRGPLYLEIGAALSGSRHSSGFGSHLFRGDGRIHASKGSVGGWLGVSGTQTRNSLDESAIRVLVPNAGLWGRAGPARLTLRYETSEVLDRRFHDVAATLSFSGDRIDLTTTVGWRPEPSDGAVPSESWASGSAAFWLLPSTAVVVSGGRYAPDVLQGLPGGDFLSIGVRWTRQRVRAVAERAQPIPLLLTSASPDEASVTFPVPDAETVEIAGDWNDWTPAALRRGESGEWLLPSQLPPGVYRFNVRIDGIRWIVPEGFPSTDDGFGGEVGILIVTEGDGPGGERR